MTTTTMAAHLLVFALFFFSLSLTFAVAAKPSSPLPECDSQGPRKDCGECFLLCLSLCFLRVRFLFERLE